MTLPWWTSKASIAVLASTALVLAFFADPAGAGRKKNKNKRGRDEPVTEPAPKPKPVTPPISLFDAPLPIGIGPVPDGLANRTAQACAGCHVKAHDTWSGSAHATGWAREDVLEAVAAAGTPACTVCHLPLIAQRPELLTFDGGRVDKPILGENPSFDASLRMEGVTCAACHIRDGVVVGPRPPEEVDAPHPMAWSKQLTSSEGCATCHQLSWPDANMPFYDTFGEWEASPYAEAGVGCTDCHGGPAAGPSSAFDHSMPRRAANAVSILLELPDLTVVRGGDPVALGIVLQNTGAGHAFPTGSPFKGIQLQAWLEGPPAEEGEPRSRTEPFTADLARTLSDGPPWNVEADTRLAVGAEKRFDTDLSLEFGVPEGAWSLHVQLVETVRGAPTDRVVQQRILPLSVE